MVDRLKLHILPEYFFQKSNTNGYNEYFCGQNIVVRPQDAF